MGSKSADDAAQIISTVYDRGVNFIDSADIYQDGKSERVFAEALKKTSIRREDIIVQSKGGIVLDPRAHNA